MTAGRHYVLGTWRIWHPVQGSRIYILTLLRTIRIWIKSMMRGSIEMLFALQFYLIFKAFLISFVKVLLCGATGQPPAVDQPYNSNTNDNDILPPLCIGVVPFGLDCTQDEAYEQQRTENIYLWMIFAGWRGIGSSSGFRNTSVSGVAPHLPCRHLWVEDILSNWCQKSALSTALTISSFTKYAYAQFNDQETWSYVSIVTWGGSSTQDHACYFVIFAAFYCWLSR